MALALTPVTVAYGEVLVYAAFVLHGVLAFILARAWIRFAQGAVQRRGSVFQFSIADGYAGIAGILPWLWLLSLALRVQHKPDSNPPDVAGIAWALAILLFFLIAGWLLGVLHRQLAELGKRDSFLAAFLATLAFQYFVVAIFVVLSFVYFAIVAVPIEVLRN